MLGEISDIENTTMAVASATSLLSKYHTDFESVPAIYAEKCNVLNGPEFNITCENSKKMLTRLFKRALNISKNSAK